MQPFSFHTIQSPTEGIYREKGSKFLAFAYPVETEEEVSQKLDQLRKKYYDAKHHCYAWVLGAAKNKFRVHDAGEPNHSAGDPILRQIRSKNLTNVLVVVVRYFGGIKLGVGGLISAYKTAAEDVLNNAVVLEKEVMNRLMLIYDYASTPDALRLVKDFDLRIVDQTFTNDCRIIAEVRLSDKEKMMEKVRLLSVTGITIRMEEL